MKLATTTFILLISFNLPVLAQSASSSAGSSGSDAAASATAGSTDLRQLQQNSTTENTSNVGGTVINSGVNNSANLSIPGRAQQGDIVCEVPVFEISAAMTNPGHGFGLNQSVIASFRTPIGGQAHSNCEARSAVALQQSMLDTTINLIRVCQDFKNQGIVLNETAPTELLNACRMIN